MKRTLLSLFVALTLGTSLSAATRDKNPSDKNPGDRKELSTRQATRQAKELKLDDKTQAWFIPLYAEYQDTLRAVRSQGMQRSKADGEKADKKKEPQKLTDAEALQRIEQLFDNEEKTLTLKRAYYKRFKEKLTPQQLLSIFNQQARPAMPQGFNRQQRGGQMLGMPGQGMRQGGFGGSGFGD